MSGMPALADIPREIMSYIAEDFREMTPNKEHNFCCGGGGGLNGIGRYREQRNVGLKVKREQILATGAKLVISPVTTAGMPYGIWKKSIKWELNGHF